MSDVLFSMVINGRARIKKNNREYRVNRKTGGKYTAPNKAYSNWESIAVILMKREMLKKWPVKFPIDFEVNLKALFYFSNMAHLPDLDNAYQGIHDALEKSGCIANDKLINGHNGSERIYKAERELVYLELTKKEVQYGSFNPY